MRRVMLILALSLTLSLTGCKTWPFGAKTSGPDVCCLAGPCSGGEPPCE